MPLFPKTGEPFEKRKIIRSRNRSTTGVRKICCSRWNCGSRLLQHNDVDHRSSTHSKHGIHCNGRWSSHRNRHRQGFACRMSGWLIPVTVWAPVFVDWMHALSLICAFLLPLLRASVLRIKGRSPCFHAPVVAHDVASGFAFPSFLALTLSGLSTEIAQHANGHAVELAGAMGIVYTLSGIFKGSHTQ
jgi:hypothetical protein